MENVTLTGMNYAYMNLHKYINNNIIYVVDEKNKFKGVEDYG